LRIDLIALDLDGTLLDPHETVSERNRAAVRAALDAGIRVVLVTGRGADMPIRVSRDLGLSLPVICAHGALTKDFSANKTLVHIPVPLQYAEPMIEFAEDQGLSLAVYHEEYFYRLAGSKIYMDDMTGPGWREARSFRDILTGAPTFMRFLGRESVEAVQREFGHLPLSFRIETWFDFVECAVLSPKATKRDALARLCADFQIPPERVLAIGDSPNDVPMLRWAGVGVAMANAPQMVRESVTHVTASNAEDGVALAIERYALPPGRTVRQVHPLPAPGAKLGGTAKKRPA
jgi:Cof subfamily protein (haloacid dehalogenase superfamily)